MSGYMAGIVAILCINLIFAYGIYVTAAAGQLNLGGAGFQAIGAYAAALAEGAAAMAAADLGRRASALCVTRAGAQPSIPRRGEV